MLSPTRSCACHLPAFLPQSCGWRPASARLPRLRLQLPTQPPTRPPCRPRPCIPAAATRRPGARFASACDAIRSFRTEIGADRLAPVPIVPASFPASFPNRGPFPPPALPGLPGTTSLSATLPAQAGPFMLEECRRGGWPCCIRPPAHACCRHYPGGGDRCVVPPSPLALPVAGSLPRNVGGSASA